MRQLAALLLLASLVAAEPLKSKIDPLVQAYLDAGKFVGAVVGVIAPDGTQFIAGYGKGAPDENTVYEIGSVSKVFTGVLLASMVNDGTVRLDQPLAELLPEGVAAPKYEDRIIKLVDLSTHSSGLPRMPDNFVPKDLTNPYADYSPAQMYAFLGAHRLRRSPGAEYEYSNYAVGMLGHVLATKEGKTYEALLRERIAGPLGMKSTVITLTPELEKRLAPGHDMNGNPVANWDIPTLAGAGGIRSDAADMMRFLRANLEAKDDAVHKALAAARTIYFDAGQPKVCLGWHVGAQGIRGHSGQTGGYHSFVVVDTERKMAVLVLSNSAVPAVDELGGQLLRVLAGEKVAPFKPRTEVAVAPATLEQYAGKYRVHGAFMLTVTVEDGQLMVQATNQPKHRVFATSDTEFFYKVVDAQITFVKDDDGKVTELVLHQNGRDMRSPKE